MFVLTSLFRFQVCHVLFGFSVTLVCTGPHKRASQRCYSANLSLHSEFRIFWKGIRGLQWSSLYLILSQLCLPWPLPALLMVHAGGNDIGKQKTLDFFFSIKKDLHGFKMSFSMYYPGFLRGCALFTLVFYPSS